MCVYVRSSSRAQKYPYGQYEMDMSGAVPGVLLTLVGVVGLPLAFAIGIITA